MAGKQAKTLSTDHIDDLFFFAERSRHPQRNRLIVLLSVKAGLRAAEIAKLTNGTVQSVSPAERFIFRFATRTEVSADLLASQTAN